MDFFGIGTAMRGITETYFRSARQTGRTAQLIDNLRDGDMVIVISSSHGKDIRDKCMARGKDVKIKTVDPKHIHLDFPPVQGRCFFEHTWVEAYYRNAIKHAEVAIDDLQGRLSRAPIPESPMMTRNEALWR